MTDPQPSHTTPDAPATSMRGRRAALAAGATAAIGAVGVVLAGPAEAAAGGPLLLGRSNSSGGVKTTVSSSTTSVVLTASGSAGHGVLGSASSAAKWGLYGRNTATAAGAGGAIRGDGHSNIGVLGVTTSENTYGVAAINASTAPGNFGALLADGRANSGLVAFTNAPTGANSNPAIYADGGDGAWASWLIGDEFVDGGLFAAFNLIGVQDPIDNIGYREAVSGEDPVHTQSGRAPIDDQGNGSVTVTASFLNAADLAAATTSVQLTAMGVAMPSLAATLTADGFTISGGAPSGSVSWTVTAARRPPATAALAAVGAKARTSSKVIAARRNASAPKRAVS